MIKLKIVSYKGKPSAQTRECEFDELGGSIGRSDTSTMVLPDPDCYVSRTHALISFRAGRYYVIDQSSASPVQVNGEALGNGQEVMLNDGDNLQIGGYSLKVLADDITVSSPGIAGIGTGKPRDDPMDIFGRSEQEGFGKGLAPDAGLSGRRNEDMSSSRSRQRGPFLDEHDALQDTSGLFPSSQNPAKQDDYAVRPTRPPGFLGDSGANSQSGLEPSIDDIIEHSGATDREQSKGNKLFEDEPVHNMPINLDPLGAMDDMPVPDTPPPPQRDDTREIHGAWPRYSGLSPQPPACVVKTSDPNDILFSWGEGNDAPEAKGIKTIIVPSPRSASESAQAPQSTLAAQAMRPTPSGPVQASMRPDAAESQPMHALQAGPGNHDETAAHELLAAFLCGAGMPRLAKQEALTPEYMAMTGELLRTCIQGTLDLLRARALFKEEFRAARTMLVEQENNPLKFSPTVEAALEHLLAPRGQGFMAPVLAINDAYNDLRAHQFAFMAGMRAALDGVLHRFDPEQLERRLAQKTLADSVLSINRKAKLWGLFAELYADINQEAQEDFHALFGKEFLRAYESQLDELDRHSGQAPQSDRS